jgi:hypothetical protein
MKNKVLKRILDEMEHETCEFSYWHNWGNGYWHNWHWHDWHNWHNWGNGPSFEVKVY